MKNIKKLVIYSLFIGCLFFINQEDVFAKYCKIPFTNQLDETDYIIFNSHEPWRIVIFQDKVQTNTMTEIKFDTNGKTFHYLDSTEPFYTDISFINGNLSFDSNGIITECPSHVSIAGDWGNVITFDMKSDSNSNVYVDDEIIKNEYENNGIASFNKTDKTDKTDFDLCGFTLDALNWIRMLIPILIILLSSMDFFKAVFSNEEDAMKKAYGKLLKRLLVAALIFLVPSILKWLIENILPEIFGNWFVEWCPSIK